MSGEGSEMPRWERELRALSGAFCDESELRRRANSIRVLIDAGLLRPVEAVPTGYDELKRASSIPNAARFEDGELPRAPDWTPAFTNEDADMLLARLDAAEAEIKALREQINGEKVERIRGDSILDDHVNSLSCRLDRLCKAGLEDER